VAFDFVPKLLSMLQDKKVMQWDNLALDPHRPFALPQQTSNCPIGECHTGSVYQMLHKKRITNPDWNQLLVPLIPYADKTHVDTFGWFTLEPLVFTTVIFKEKFRCHHVAWKPLGYIANQHQSRATNKITPQGDNQRNYHQQLAVLLQRIKSEQNGTTKLLQNITIFMNNQQVIVDIIYPILFIIADTPAADTMCGWFNSYQLQIGHLHKACNVSPHDADKPNHQCAWLTKEQLMHSSCQEAKQAHQPLSMHYHPNHAFQHLEIGCDVNGVFGATPMDTMHGIRH
jgi:hypothetical protein